MDPRALIATRIDLHLRQHLDIGVDTFRALSDKVYMRDVLFVCDAMRMTRLPLLAHQFRVAGQRFQQESHGRAGHAAGPPQDWATNTSGFGASLPPAPASAAPASPDRPWYSPRRWRNA